MLSFFLIDIVSLSHNIPLVISLATIYVILCLIVVYYAFHATYINPSDPTIALEKDCKQKGLIFDSDKYEYHCNICDSHVMQGSKHCGQCNRCTSGFDHHCRYLNNCIGEQNYNQFFKLIVWVFWMCLMHNITNGFVIWHIVADKSELKEQHKEFYDKILTAEFLVILICMIVLNFCALAFLVNLTKFHIELKYKGLTTYEFLKMKENNTRESRVVVRKELREQMINDERER